MQSQNSKGPKLLAAGMVSAVSASGAQFYIYNCAWLSGVKLLLCAEVPFRRAKARCKSDCIWLANNRASKPMLRDVIKNLNCLSLSLGVANFPHNSAQEEKKVVLLTALLYLRRLHSDLWMWWRWSPAVTAVSTTSLCLRYQFSVRTYCLQYLICEKIGVGAYGTVYRAVERASGKNWAAKMVSVLPGVKKETVVHEIAIMNELHHEKLLNLHEAFDLGTEMCLIEELLVTSFIAELKWNDSKQRTWGTEEE